MLRMITATTPPGVPVRHAGVTGNVRLIRDVPAPSLGGTRDVVVYLPPGYEESNNKERYPVLYVHDGQNIFDPSTAFLGREWHLDETAEQLIRDGKTMPFIMVGVYNNGEKRIDEYTPVPDAKYGGGHADAYGDFLINEVKPFVDQHYRTQPDAAHTGIMGSSLGGLVSLYLGFQHPEVFGLVGALSPSLWWAHQQLTQSLAGSHGAGPRAIWMDMGTAEDPQDDDHNGVPDMIDDARRMRDVLESRGFHEGQNLQYREVEGATHDEPAWAARADQVLTFLLPRT